MKKTELKARWSSPDYLGSIKAQLAAIFDGRSFHEEADLRGMIVGLDRAVKALESASFDQAAVSLVDLSVCRFSCSFAKSEFNEVVFNESFFDTCNMTGARFSNCHFESAKLTAPTMDDALLFDCEFSKATLKGRGTHEYGGRRTVFQGCSFRDSQIKALELRACRFVRCQLDGAIFEKCDLRGVEFENCNAREEQFVDCDLNGAVIA